MATKDQDWWIIEYDSQRNDSHAFETRIQREIESLLAVAGNSARGAKVLRRRAPDNKYQIYFNPKAACLPGAPAFLSRYGAKPCKKPTDDGEPLRGFASS